MSLRDDLPYGAGRPFFIFLLLTQALGQEVLDELCVISDVQHAVDAGVHQLLLLVTQILADVLRHKDDVSLHVDNEEEAVQGLKVCGRRKTRWKESEGDNNINI